jgi:hypothetical protein
VKVAGPGRLANLFGPVNFYQGNIEHGIWPARLSNTWCGKDAGKNKFKNGRKRSFCHVKNICGIQRLFIVPPVAVYRFFGSRHIDEFTAGSGVVDGWGLNPLLVSNPALPLPPSPRAMEDRSRQAGSHPVWAFLD